MERLVSSLWFLSRARFSQNAISKLSPFCKALSSRFAVKEIASRAIESSSPQPLKDVVYHSYGRIAAANVEHESATDLICTHVELDREPLVLKSAPRRITEIDFGNKRLNRSDNIISMPQGFGTKIIGDVLDPQNVGHVLHANVPAHRG